MQEKNTFKVIIFMENTLKLSQPLGWAALPIKKLLSTKEAMKQYRLKNPVCEITGSSKKCQVHHIIPVWANPEIADDQNNMITLSTCANIHHIYGHDRNFRLKYNLNIKEISKKMIDLQKELDIVNRNMNKVQANQKQVSVETFSVIQWIKEKIIEWWIRG